MGHRTLRETVNVTKDAHAFLHRVFDKMKLSARSYDRILKVSQTIADLAGKEAVEEDHIAEAVSYRNKCKDVMICRRQKSKSMGQHWLRCLSSEPGEFAVLFQKSVLVKVHGTRI